MGGQELIKKWNVLRARESLMVGCVRELFVIHSKSEVIIAGL